MEGCYLNRYSPAVKFKDDEIYEICSNMKRNFDKNLVPEVEHLSPITTEETPPLELPTPTCKVERIQFRQAKSIEKQYERTIDDLHHQNTILIETAARSSKQQRTNDCEPLLPQTPTQAPAPPEVTKENMTPGTKNKRRHVVFKDKVEDE